MLLPSKQSHGLLNGWVVFIFFLQNRGENASNNVGQFVPVYIYLRTQNKT